MPIPKPLPELQQELRDLLTEDLAGALKMLQQLLPPGSEKHQTVTTLLGKLNDTNKARLRGTIANDELQLAYNQLRSDLLDLIDGLDTADFDTATAMPEAKKAKQGEILYRIPHAMPLGRETRCLVRIALDADAIVENITLDEHVTLKPLMRVSDLMQVELLDPSGEPTFQIRSISSPEQIVEDEGYTEWLFWVTPLRAGTFPLMIKVSVIELLLGKERKKEIVLEEIIRISADAPGASAEAPLKSAGEKLLFSEPAGDTPVSRSLDDIIYAESESMPAPSPQAPGTDIPMPSPIYTPPVFIPAEPAQAKQRSGSRPFRAVALFLAFLVLSAGATWAIAPQEAAWVWTRYVQDTPEAYTQYAAKYEQSRHREKAVFRKALLTNTAADLQTYLREYPSGQFLEKTRVALETLERRDFEVLRKTPETSRVREFIATYPNSRRLEAVQQLVDSTAKTLPNEQLHLEVQQRIDKRRLLLKEGESQPSRLEQRQQNFQNRRNGQ